MHCVSRHIDFNILNVRVPLALGPTKTLNSSIIYQQAQGSRSAPGWAVQLEQDARPFCLLSSRIDEQAADLSEIFGKFQQQHRLGLRWPLDKI